MTTQTAEKTAATEEKTSACSVCGGVEGNHVVQPENLDCPDCIVRAGIHSKMGNKRADCKRCNRFAQRLIRSAARRLQDEHEEHYEALRNEAEVELYLAEIDA